jgi:glycine betaine/proline transport system substrate-binding protein
MVEAGRAMLLALAMMIAAVGSPMAQITVLDNAQDQVAGAAAAPPPCGTKPITIARMPWPSAEILAEIHALLLRQEFGCAVELVPGDLAVTASSMGSSGQPAVAPELWVTRAAEVWNAGVEAQMLRPAAPSYEETTFEGWFVPGFMAAAQPGLTGAAALASVLPLVNAGAPVRFISCPPDWACAVINRNLVAAHGLQAMVEIVEPANRFEMDTLIAQAMSRSDPIVFYYWQPNAVLAQFEFLALDMGPYDAESAQCLARLACPAPMPSAFVPETVVNAVADWVFGEAPMVAAYFGRASLPLSEMNAMMAALSQGGTTAEAVAAGFVADRNAVWSSWTGIAAAVQ